MIFSISRDSVCMSDDAYDHCISYEANEHTTFTQLFRDLIGQRFFPRVSGNNVIWVLMCCSDDLVSWYSSRNAFYSRFTTTEPNILSVKPWTSQAAIHFRYYYDPIQRARHIYMQHQGIAHQIWHAGYMPEYRALHISSQQETHWKEELV